VRDHSFLGYMIYLKGKKMGKGMKPKKGYNDKKYKDNYDRIFNPKPDKNPEPRNDVRRSNLGRTDTSNSKGIQDR